MGSLLGDEEDVDGGGVDLVEVGQRRHAGVGRVDAAVELYQPDNHEQGFSQILPELRGSGEGEVGVGEKRVRTRTVRPLKVMWTQERPTSLPAPSGVMTIWSPSRPPDAGRFPAGGAVATDAIFLGESWEAAGTGAGPGRRRRGLGFWRSVRVLEAQLSWPSIQ